MSQALFNGSASRLSWPAAWILLSVWAVGSGWTLSLLGSLNVAGYVGSAVVAGALIFWSFRAGVWKFGPRGQVVRRFHRLLPVCWLLLALLALLGGVLSEPNNYDYLTYRFPRVLNWWWEGHWLWIESSNERMNYSGTGFEWLMAPLFVFFKTGRFFFLINLASYLLLPGLVFSVFRGLGLGRRMAWMWMWILPSGYCFVMQAGSAGNDGFAAVYLMASLHFSLRARRTGRMGDLLLAILAAALLTGAKASNLPLVLPCVIAMGPSLRLLLRRPLLSAAGLGLALLVSFVPMAVINQQHTGDWSGDPHNARHLHLSDSVAGLVGNSLQITAAMLAPPVFPMAGWWNGHAKKWIPQGMRERLTREFPRFSPSLGEITVEEAAGLGLGVTLMLAALLGRGLLPDSRRPGSGRQGRLSPFQIAIAAGGVAALLFCMTKLGSESGARIMSTYYPLAVAAFLMLLPRDFPRARIWSVTAGVVVLSAVPALLMTPARPLLPVTNLVIFLEKKGLRSPVLERAKRVYEVYAHRADTLGPLRPFLPEGVTEIGFIQGGDDSEVSLWKPFGSRRVVDGESAGPVSWVVASESALRNRLGQSLKVWSEERGYEVTAQCVIVSKVQEGPVEWVVARNLKKPDGP